jgi:hypothetical protein
MVIEYSPHAAQMEIHRARGFRFRTVSILRKQCVQIANGVAIETDLRTSIHQQFNGRLVIQDHLRLTRIPSLGILPEFQ